MNARNVVPSGRTRISTSAKAIAIVVAMAAVALAADHAYFVAPRAQAHSVTSTETPVSVQVDGFALPESLRPTAADVSAPAPTF